MIYLETETNKEETRDALTTLASIRYGDYDTRKSNFPVNVRVAVAAQHILQYEQHLCIGVRAPAPLLLLMVAHKILGAYTNLIPSGVFVSVWISM